jgi:hypothetical protein
MDILILFALFGLFNILNIQPKKQSTMKNLFTILVVVLLTSSLFAQPPNKMSYQAIVRNSGGDIWIIGRNNGLYRNPNDIHEC